MPKSPEEFNLEKKENIETSKLEWGPELGFMSWDEAQEQITMLNKTVAEGESFWRLPSTKELINLYNRTNSAPEGFSIESYWSNTNGALSDKTAEVVYMKTNLLVDTVDKNKGPYLVRCVR